MALHYILDGYNIVKRVPWLAELRLEDGRRGLVRFLSDQRPQGSLQNKVTIVFDGQAGILGRDESVIGIKIIFTCDETADDRIKKLIAKAENKKNIVVVTNDRALRYYVKALGAGVLDVDKFFYRSTPCRKKEKKPRPAKETKPLKQITRDMAEGINKEMENVWLQKKRKSHE